MKKIISAIAVIGTLALAGCNNNGGGGGTETNSVTSISAGVSNGMPSLTITNNHATTTNTP